MNRRFGLVVTIVAAVACGSTDDGGSGAPAPAPGSTAGTRTEITVLADSVEIDELDVLQGTTARLVTDATIADQPNAPVIANRPGLVRAHARLTDRTKLTPELVAELRVRVPGKDDLVVQGGPLMLYELDASSLATTWNFELPAEAFAPGAAISVKVTYPKLPQDPGVTFPRDPGAFFPLGANASAPKLKVQFVPVTYNHDGSGRTPALDEATLATYETALYEMYPAAEIEVGVREAIPWGLEVDPRGDGWNSLLRAVTGARNADKPTPDTYYVGVVQPAATLDEYCEQGCVLGLAPQTNLIDIALRAAMIVGYGSPREGGTLAQELAHAMGRLHAPCGRPQAVDTDYPYARAAIGVPGWNVVTKELVDPEGRSKDFMSYCSPVWVSDYTWSGIFERMVDVQQQIAHEAARPDDADADAGADADGGGDASASASAGAASGDADADGDAASRAGAFRAFDFDGEDGLEVGDPIEIAGGAAAADAAAAAGPSVTVRWESASGEPLGSARAGFRPYDSIPGGVVVAPEAPDGAALVRIEGLRPRALTASLAASRRVGPAAAPPRSPR
jgi:hypothetical protein